MADSAEQLQRIYLAGFELQTFERYAKCVGVVRDGCVALLVPGVDGLQVLGTPGWRMGEVMGVLTESGGRKVFQAKNEIVEATAERLAALEKFRADLRELLHPASPRVH
jgi:hypothetical protein